MTDSLSRRTVLAGAAWSVPVVALAVATPAAAASGTVSVSFIGTFVKLHRSDTVAAFVRIENVSGADVAPQVLEVILTDVPPTDELAVTFPEDAVTMTDGENNALPVANGFFSATGTGTDTLVITSDGPIGLAAGQTIDFGIYVHWPAENLREEAYVIAGTFTFGTGDSGTLGTTVELIA